MIIIGKEYKTKAEALTPDCKVVPVGTLITVQDIGEIVKVSSQCGDFYIDVDKINKG